MLVKLTDGTEITCTVDEYEELYVRGLVGKNGAREALQDFLEPQKTDTPKIKDLPKMPTPIAVYGVQMPGTVALYGCQQVPDTNGHLYKGDRITTSGNTTTNIKMGTPAFELLRSIYDIGNIAIKLNHLKHHRKLCVYFENGDTAQRIRVFEEELHSSGAYQWTPEIKKLFEIYDNEMIIQGESRNGNN